MRLSYSWFLAVTLVVTSTNVLQTKYRVPADRGDGWKTASPDSVGIDSKKLADLTQSLRSWPELGVHAVLIERNGQLIYEEYFDGFDERLRSSPVATTISESVTHSVRESCANTLFRQ